MRRLVAGGAASFCLLRDRSSTVPVTPSVMAAPNAMSEISASRSVASADDVVGFFLKSLFLPSAATPKIVPTITPTPATPYVA